MLFYICVVVASLYSLVTIALLGLQIYLKWKLGLAGFVVKINTLAGTKTVTLFKFYSYVSLVACAALVLPWFDLFTIEWINQHENGGFRTYFGWMTSHEADIYFVIALMNIIGIKGGMKVIELTRALEKGPLWVFQHAFLEFWVAK